MKENNIDWLLDKVPNKFLLVNAVAGRAKQIMEGSLPYIEGSDPEDPIDTAVKEIIGERITVEVSKEKKKEVKPFDFEKAVASSVIETLAKKEQKKYIKKK